MNDFDRGEDAQNTVTLQNSSGTALDTANFGEIVVKVSHKHLGTELGRYSVADGMVTKEDPTSDGQITFTVLGSTTANAALGVYEYQVYTRDYDGSPPKQKFKGDCFYLKSAKT